jgi:hypothetical protein
MQLLKSASLRHGTEIVKISKYLVDVLNCGNEQFRRDPS